MANNPINTTTNAAIVPELWSARFYEVLRVTLPFLSSVNTDYEGEIKDLGDILNISTISDFDEAGILSEGASGDTEVPTVSGQQLVINKRIYKDFIVTKRSKLQSLPFMDSVREKATFSIAKKMQQLIIDTIVPSAATPDHTIAYDAGTTLALADILEAKELLDTQNVEEEDRTGTVGAAQLNDIFNITGFTSRDFIPAGSPLTEGKIPTQLAGFTMKFTTVVGNTSYWHHKSFLTFAIQDDLNIEVFNLGVDGVRGSRVNTDLLGGFKQLSNVRVVSIA